MKFQVSNDAKNKTTQCPSDFHCLSDNEKPMCDVEKPMCFSEYVSEGYGLFVKPLGDHECPYQMPYKTGFLCTCPTRREIFLNYKV